MLRIDRTIGPCTFQADPLASNQPFAHFCPFIPTTSAPHPQILALACQPESRAAEVCRLPVARARPFLRFEECHLPTLLVFTASPADRSVPEKRAYPEIAASAGDTERPETGPGVERARSALLRFFHLPPSGSWVWRLCAPAHISAIGAQSCTNEKSPPVPRPGITITNHYYLEGIGFDPQNRAQPAPTGASETPLAGNQTAPPKTRILGPDREFVFSAAPQDRSFRAAPPIRAYSRLSAQKCTSLKPLPLAAPRITKAKDSHLSKIGFLPQKASADCASAPVGRTDSP